jgi:hypothetical protein
VTPYILPGCPGLDPFPQKVAGISLHLQVASLLLAADFVAVATEQAQSPNLPPNLPTKKQLRQRRVAAVRRQFLSSWPFADVSPTLSHVGRRANSGQHLFAMSLSHFEHEQMLLTPPRRSLAALGEPSTNMPGEALQQWRFLR